MAFSANTFSVISQGGDANSPAVYSYNSKTDLISAIMAPFYFASTINSGYPMPVGYQNILRTGDEILIKDAAGNSYNVSIVNTNNTITLTGKNSFILQNEIVNAGAGVSKIDVPPAGYLYKIQAIRNVGSLTEGSCLVSLYRNNATLITSFTTTKGDTGVYAPAMPTDTTLLPFNGAINDANQTIKLTSANTGTGTFNIKVNMYFLPSVQL